MNRPPGPSDGFKLESSPLQERPRCRWCRGHLVATVRSDAEFCSKRCRQAAFRLRKRGVAEVLSDRKMRVGYADPPYPGLSSKYYRHEPTFAGEVDHAALVASLVDGYDGWALSTSAAGLRLVLPLCPPGVRVCAWVKPKVGLEVPSTHGIHNAWEPVIVKPARHENPGVRDWDCLHAHAARGGGTLPGRKPLAFCSWLFRLLGLRPGDELVDLFPGTGVVGASWAELSRAAARDASPAPAGDASPGAGGDTSL